MALLRSRDGTAHVPLSGHNLVGRAPSCVLRIKDRRVSTEHARLTWDGERWQVRDLGSTNGTWVAGRQLRAGETVSVHQGSELCFGDLELSYLLEAAGAPAPVARRPDDGALVEAEDGVLALPGPDAPELTVFEGGDGSWVAEQDSVVIHVVDGAALTVGAETWVLHLPQALDPTVATSDLGAELSACELVFFVSDDEERVALEVRHPGGASRIKPRAHLYTLLTLARLRVEDTEATEGQRGWVYAEELQRMLAVDEVRLNVEVYRCRKELGKLGIRGSAAVIERHRGTRQLRCGTARVSVQRL